MDNMQRAKINIHNCHVHTFRFDDVPVNFLPFGLIRLISKGSISFARILNLLTPGTDPSVFDRYANFLRLAKCPNQLETLQFLMKFYPSNTSYAILSMDMHFMGAGRVPRSYEEQLNELSLLKKKYPNFVFPFLAVDPRRENLLSLVRHYIEDHHFCGLKLYPPLGFFPNDVRLFPIYDYACDNELPIIVHSSKNSPVYSRASKKKIKKVIQEKLSTSTDIFVDLNKKGKKELCNYFTHPFNYKEIIEQYPKLKICFAHFGGISEWLSFLYPSTIDLCTKRPVVEHPSERSWFEIIYDMMKIHKTLFADISYTLTIRDFFPLLRILLANNSIRNQILFGSDFYMVESNVPERLFGVDLHGFLGSEDFRQICETNPKTFLKNCLQQ